MNIICEALMLVIYIVLEFVLDLQRQVFDHKVNHQKTTVF